MGGYQRTKKSDVYPFPLLMSVLVLCVHFLLVLVINELLILTQSNNWLLRSTKTDLSQDITKDLFINKLLTAATLNLGTGTRPEEGYL